MPESLITIAVARGEAEVATEPKAVATAETENVATVNIVEARMLNKLISVLFSIFTFHAIGRRLSAKYESPTHPMAVRLRIVGRIHSIEAVFVR